MHSICLSPSTGTTTTTTTTTKSRSLLSSTKPTLLLLLLFYIQILLLLPSLLLSKNYCCYCMAFSSTIQQGTTGSTSFVRSLFIRRQSQQYHHYYYSKQQQEQQATRISFNSGAFFSSSASSSSAEITSGTTMSNPSIVGPELPPVPNNAKRIFWIRHGEVINPGGTRNVYYGAQDVPLSDLGKQEAIAAAQYLQQFNLSKVYSSTLSRAIYGAERVIDYQKKELTPSKQKELQLVQVPGFMELDRGAWCGLTIDEIGRNNMAKFDAGDESITPAGGESYRTLRNRVIDARNNPVLQQMEPGTAAAVVCHLQVTRCIVADALQIPLSEMVNKVSIATASITCIDYYIPNNNDDDDTTTTPTTTTATLHYKSFKPADVIGLQKANDGAN